VPQAKVKAAKPKGAGAGAGDGGAASSSGVRIHGKTVEQIYQKKSQLEHILLRPDSYGAWWRGPGSPVASGRDRVKLRA
jgi:hypothetical protein